MKRKSLTPVVVIIADLILCSHIAVAQTPTIDQPEGDIPELELNTWNLGGPFNLLVDDCKNSNEGQACYVVGKNFILAAGGFDAFKGTQEKIVKQLKDIAAQEQAAIDSLKVVAKMDSETLAQMQQWVTQVQNLASSINVAAQKEKLDSQWGLWFLDKGCKLNYQDACIDLSIGLAYRNEGYISPTVVKEIEGYCDKGFGNACNYLGGLYLQGEYVPKSAEKAAEYYSFGCGATNHNLDACQSIAKMYETGNGVAKDPAKAREVYRFLCMKDSSMCSDLNRMKKVTGEVEAPIFDLGEKLFPDLYKDLKKEVAKTKISDL
ncbi:MAG: hypothetical protein LUC43_00755 [Burkholderiales bacterium]|nr:hypothetical protein [Burkholderiales bacterium]